MSDYSPEEEAFLSFRRKYTLQTPPPRKPSAVSVRTIGFQFWLYLVTSIAAVLLAAMRTTEAFYDVAFKSSKNPMFSFGEASLAILAIEGGLVVYAAARAIRLQKVEIKGGIGLVGIALMIAISMIAGLVQSTAIIDNIDQKFLSFLQYSLAFALGVGVSIIAYISGEILGGQVALVTKNYEELIKKFDEATDAYNKSILASWGRSRERRSVRPVDVRTEPQRTPNPPIRDGVKKRMINEFLDAKRASGEPTPTIQEIMNYASAAKGYVSDIRAVWLAENNGHTPEENDEHL
jgi:hypothetical protein